MAPSMVEPMATDAVPRILVVASQGTGSDDERRIMALLEDLDPELVPFHRARRIRSATGLLRRLLRTPPDLLVVEGTGLGAGLPALAANLLRGVPFVVSGGDAVGPFLRLHGRLAGAIGAVYERLLCRRSAGYVGWTPYLVGRALTFGAPRGVTAAGWAPGGYDPDGRERVRAALGIPPDDVVFGIAGSLTWTASRQWCYGLELVRALRSVERRDLRVLVVGDGDGLARLRAAAGGDRRIVFTGRVGRDAVPDLLSAMDVASLPQSRDGVGLFRYTTKLSEYLASGLPVVTGRLPFAYDLPGHDVRRLPGQAPWDATYVAALAGTMEGATVSERVVRPTDPAFDRDAQCRRVAAFITEILEERRAG